MWKRVPIACKLSAAFAVIIVVVLVGMDYVVGLYAPPESAASRHWITLIAILVALGLACVISRYLAGRLIKRPVDELLSGMDRLADKDFDFRLDEDRGDEFSALAASFNDLVTILSSSLTELKKSQDYMRSILESSADIIITVFPSGKIRTFNAGAEQALGYPRLEVIGQPIEMLFADPQERRVAIERLQYTDAVVNYETRFVTKTGQIRNVLLTISRLRNPAGEVIGTIGISKDITEEKRLQNQLIQAQRLVAVGEVFTSVQHSMKNMLNACKGGAYMVKAGLANDNRKMLVEGWGMVEEGISRMTDMSTDMLKYVKEWKPRPDRVDLSRILSDIHRLIKQTAQDKGITFRVILSPEIPPVVCDARMIHSAVMDIVSNALDACLWKAYTEEETPEVVLSAYPGKGEEVVIEVRDNGCGMTEEVKANIFSPFFSTKSKAGTGLGLSITSRMISVHGGEIEVESEPDRGAIFRIVLPIDRTDRSKEDIDGKKGPGS